MKDYAARTRRRLWARLLVACLWVPALSVSGWSPTALAEPKTVKVALKVCVRDEQGNPSSTKPTLFNSPNRIDKAAGTCYESGRIQLDTKQLYFVAAFSDLQTYDVVALTVSATDEVKEFLEINLKLSRHQEPVKPSIEVCLKDDGNNSVPIQDLLPGESSAVNKETSAKSGCLKVSAAPAREYNLTLTTATVAPEKTYSRLAGLGIAGVLLLTFAGLGLSGVLLVKLTRIPTDTATQISVSDLAGKMSGLNQQVIALESRVTGLRLAPPPIPSGEPHGGAAAKGNADVPRDAEVEKIKPTPEPPPPPPRELETPKEGIYDPQRNCLEAKQRYRSFANGETVDHFFLMPSGASYATNMVEDSSVELLEQNNGTYVAILSQGDANEAWVFPMPRIYFTPGTFKALFPNLTEEQYDNGDIEPRCASLIAPKLWKLIG